MKSICLYMENYNLLFEMSIPKSSQISDLIQSNEQVKKFIDLAKKSFTKGLTPTEQKEADELFKDAKVRKLLEAAEKVGQREGWIRGGKVGSMIGGAVGAIGGIAAGGPVFALALLGAVIGGISIGYLLSRVHGVLNRWKTEEEIASGRGMRLSV